MTGLSQLAKKLAINHWNTSLATRNLDHALDIYNLEPDDSLKIIFTDPPEAFCTKHEGFYELGFTRNILIIGAGASKDIGLPTADELTDLAFQELGIYNMLSGNHDVSTIKNILLTKLVNHGENSFNYQAEKFFSLCFHYLKKIKNYELSLGNLIAELKFEGCLFVLKKFVTKRDLNIFLRDQIGKNRYTTSLFYEIVAHLFKHRFIDVIVNLNFDETLDNALEDEFGRGEFIRIYNDCTCVEFPNTLVNGRLRKPLYIKPHGTIGDLDSILYSTSQYIDISPQITDVLSDVFSGRTQENLDNKNEKITKQFNIVLVGYALNDPDIEKVLKQNIKKNIDNTLRTKFYIFNPKADEIKSNILDKLCENNGNKIKENIYSIRLATDLKNNLSDLDLSFLSLFRKIQNSFNPHLFLLVQQDIFGTLLSLIRCIGRKIEYRSKFALIEQRQTYCLIFVSLMVACLKVLYIVTEQENIMACS